MVRDCVTMSGGQRSPENLFTWVSSEWLDRGPCQTPNPLACGVKVHVFYNRQNKLGFWRDLRLFHIWMTVLHYCLHIRHIQRLARRRLLSDNLKLLQLFVCMNVLYMHFVFYNMSPVSNKQLCIAPHQFFSQTGNDNNLMVVCRKITSPNTLFALFTCSLPAAQCIMQNITDKWGQ